jgi:hypothetical protein
MASVSGEHYRREAAACVRPELAARRSRGVATTQRHALDERDPDQSRDEPPGEWQQAHEGGQVLVQDRDLQPQQSSDSAHQGQHNPAVPRPTALWNLPATDNANAGAAIPFTYTATKIPAGATVDVLEQNVRTHDWDPVLNVTSHSGSGSGSIPAQQIGAGLKFQIGVVDRGAVLVYENTKLNVFGQVSFSMLETTAGSSGAYTNPTSTFNYQFGFQNPETTPLLQVSATDNDCTSVNLDFIEGDLSDPSVNEQGDMDTLSIVQQSQSPLSSTVNFNQLGNLQAILVPGQSWSVTASSTGDVAGVAPSGFVGTYLNGYAVCDSTNPILQVGSQAP